MKIALFTGDYLAWSNALSRTLARLKVRPADEVGVPDGTVAGRGIPHDDSQFERGQAGQPAEYRGGVRAAAVLSGENDRRGARPA